MPATIADFTSFANTDQPLNSQWIVMARCLQSLAAYNPAKISTGVEPLDVLSGLYLGVDGQAVTSKDWRIYVNASDQLSIDQNVSTDASPVWLNTFLLGGGGGGSFSVADTATIDLTLSGTTVSGIVVPGSLDNTHLSATAGILPSQLVALPLGKAVVTDALGFLATATPTAAEINFLSGAASNLQAQIDAITVGGGSVTSVADTATIDLMLVAGVLNAVVQPTSLDDSYIAPGAAIALSKLAALAAGRVVVSDGSGFLTIASPTSAEINFVSGASSNLQAQINALASSVLSVNDSTTIDLTLTGNVLSGVVANGSLTNAQIAPTAAITYSKLALTGSLVNADVSATAAIAYSKLALGGSVVNADISSAAAIAVAKLAALTASKAVATNPSGVLTTATTTAAELDFVSGATSNLQTQITARASLGAPVENFVVFKGSSATTVASSAGVLTINMEASNYYEVTLTENVTSVVMNNTSRAGARTILFKQSGAATFTVAGWPTVLWPGGTAPVFTTGAAARDLVSIIIDSGGAKHGVFSQAFA